jgi:hypothetical protein
VAVLVHIQRDQAVRIVRHRSSLDRQLEGAVPAAVEDVKRAGRVEGNRQVGQPS